MKKILVVGLLVAAAGSSIFASGNKEEEQAVPYGAGPRGGYAGKWDDDSNYSRGGRGMMYWADEEGNPVNAPELEEVTVEGTLVLETGTHPYIEENGEKVFIMVPSFAIADLELEGGESVKVTGYEVPEGGPMFWSAEEDIRFIQVTSAEINGETLTLEGGYGAGRMAYGDQSWCAPGSYGRSGSRGRARW